MLMKQVQLFIDVRPECIFGRRVLHSGNLVSHFVLQSNFSNLISSLAVLDILELRVLLTLIYLQ